MHADTTHFHTFSEPVRLWEHVRTSSALPGFVWKDMWMRTGRSPEDGRSMHISWATIDVCDILASQPGYMYVSIVSRYTTRNTYTQEIPCTALFGVYVCVPMEQ